MPKGLIEVDGRPWLEHQLDALRHHGLRQVVVVLGHHADAYRAVLDSRSVVCAVNPEPDRGPFSSLQVGLEALPSGSGAWILPLDVPCPAEEVWRELEQHGMGPAVDAAVPTYQGHGGHPVLLSPELVARLLALPVEHPDSRLDRQLHQLPRERVVRIEVRDPRVLDNLNTAEDFRRHQA